MSGLPKDSRRDPIFKLALGPVPAALPVDELQRLEALRETAVLDTAPEQTYDDLTALAAHICGTPIALISLVDRDRQWFKSRVGLAATETPRELAFCAHALLYPDELFEVEDASRDMRFAGNPLVTDKPDIRFYAGSPLLSEEGHALGTLCVIDRKPRQLDEHQRASLRTIGRLASELLRNRRQDARVHEVRERFRTVFQQTSAGIAMTDLAGRFTLVNQRFCTITGRNEAELMPMRLQDITHPDDLAASREKFERLVQYGEAFTIEQRYLRPDGGIAWVSNQISPILDTLGKATAVVAAVEDISARKSVEAQMRESEDRFIRMAQHAPLKMWITDASGACTFLNKLWCEFVGLPMQDQLGNDRSRCLHPEDAPAAHAAFAAASEARQPYRREIRLRRHDGRYHWHIDAAEPRFDDDGAFLGYVGTAVDVQSQYDANDRLERLVVERTAQLMASEARYRELADDNPAMMIRCRNEPGWPMLYVSQAVEQITGYPPSSFVGQQVLWGSLILPEDIPAMTEKLAQQLAQGTDIQVEYRIRHRDGSIRWIEGNARLKKLHDGSEIYEGMNFDITGRKAAEQALAESEQRYRQLADNNPALIFRCYNRPGWPMIYMSQAVEKITGYPASAFIEGGRRWGDMLLPEVLEETARNMDAQMAQGDVVVVSYRIRHADGSIRWLEGNARLLTLPDGEQGFEGAITDITDRKQAQLLLAERATALERATIATNAARIAPFTWYVARDYFETDALAAVLLGLEPEDAAAGTFAAYTTRVHPDDRASLSSEIERLLARGGPEFLIEFRTVSAQGRVRWIRSVGRLDVMNGERHVTGALTDSTLEIEVQRALEDRTREMERANTELDEFTYIASHDLKEPLRGIHNYTRFIAEDYADKLDAAGQKMLKAVSEQADRMQRLIEDLLEIARLGREPMKQVETDLDKVLDEVLASLAFSLGEKKVELRRQPLGTVVCDRVRVAEVFRNLVTNALKYNDKPVPVIEIGSRTGAAGNPEFYVQDNGIGIKPDFHARVFAPFKRLHAKDAYGGGSGVGLAIVKRIVEAHGGYIGVRSEVGQGATFAFTLSGGSHD